MVVNDLRKLAAEYEEEFNQYERLKKGESVEVNLNQDLELTSPERILMHRRVAAGVVIKHPFLVPDHEMVPRDSDGIFIHKKNSVRAAHNIEDVDLAFVDGDHSLNGFLADMYSYAGKVAHYISGHDFNLGTFPGIGIALLHCRVPGTKPFDRFGWRFENSTVMMDVDYTWWMKVS